MTDHRKLIARLEALVDRNNQPDWEDVVRRAEAPVQEPRSASARRSRRSYLARRFVPVFVLAAVVFAFVLIAPWQRGPEGTVMERALAALGDRPILHAVLLSDTSWSFVDLASGEEKPMVDRQEIWYDSKRHFERIRTTTEGGLRSRYSNDLLLTPTGTWASTWDDVEGPRPVPSLDPALEEFFDGYRSALEKGTAYVAGTGAVDGHDVIWIEFATKRRCPYHACRERVALDKSSSLPIQIAWYRKGTAVSRGIDVASIETLPAGGADFSKPKRVAEGSNFFVGRQATPITLSGATEELPGAFWVGKSISGLELSSVSRVDLTTRETPEPTSAESIDTTIELHYGNDSPAVLFSKPLETTEGPSRGHVVIHEAAKPSTDVWSVPSDPVPGSMLSNGKGEGALMKDGIYVAIYASSQELLIKTARALEPIQPSTETG
ncbi:MAG: hypothetical protein WBQ14_00595 [Gaiellaceae bacterium]